MIIKQSSICNPKTILLLLLTVLLSGCAELPDGSRSGQPMSTQFNDLRIYQIMVEAFIDGDSSRGYGVGYGPSHHRGDLRGIIKALPYIKSLGMNAIWLTPIFDSEKGTGDRPRLDATGYYPRNFFKIDPQFGTLEDAREMVQTAHGLGLYVFFDGVFGHHKAGVRPSPTGKLPVGSPNQVDYPQSLPFFKEVALYWIKELEIDGWRLDQAFQVPIPAWQEIREAVEEKCARRKAAGKQWGTLGYMVGEVFSGEKNIARQAYGSEDTPGLLSAFDFPLRYRLVQTLAVEENGKSTKSTSVLNDGFATHQIYPAFAIPNLMLSNHDLVRFGDLLQRGGFGGPNTVQYWQRHRCALAFLAAYSGPITLYYGDESGQEVAGFAQQISDRCWEIDRCDDHVARSSGQIDNFNPRQQALIDYWRKLMQIRVDYPAMVHGERQNLVADKHLYVDLKTFPDGDIIFLMNRGEDAQSWNIPADLQSPSGYRDLLSGEVFDQAKIEVAGLSCRFLVRR